MALAGIHSTGVSHSFTGRLLGYGTLKLGDGPGGRDVRYVTDAERVADAPLRQTQQGTFYKRDRERLEDDPVIAGPIADALEPLPDMPPFWLNLAQGVGVLQGDRFDAGLALDLQVGGEVAQVGVVGVGGAVDHVQRVDIVAKKFIYVQRLVKRGLEQQAETHQAHRVHISLVHCELALSNDGVYLNDCDSTNGTFLNGDPVKEAWLSPGQELRLGDVELFECGEGDGPVGIGPQVCQ